MGYALLSKSKTAVLVVSNLMAKQSTRLYKNKQTRAFPESHKEKALYEMSLTSEIFNAFAIYYIHASASVPTSFLLRATWDISGKQYLSEALANHPSAFEGAETGT